MDTTIAIIIAALLAGLSKGGLGGPVPVSLIAPILSQAMPTQQAIGITLPILIFADIFALRMYWNAWDMKYVRLMLPMAIVGILMGIFLLASLPEGVLRRTMGIFTLIVVIYKVAGDYLIAFTYTSRNWHGYLAGWLSGFGSALANVGSPPFTAYMLLQKVSPRVFIGTTTLFFAIVNVIKLPGFILSGSLDVEQFLNIAWALLIIPISVWIGRKLIDRINPRAFELMMLTLLFIMSLVLIFGPVPN